MGKINSKNKGSAGEREAAKLLRDHGYEDARRTQQYCGANADADIVCESLPVNHHIEVKRVQKLNVEKALQQAESDCKNTEQVPIVFHRANLEKWKVTMRAEEYLKILENLKNE